MLNSYSDIINSAIGSVYRTGIANKILQHMDRIRNVSDDGQARRWVMELLQNCSDTAYDGRSVNVRITLDSDKLTFSHNGKPFRVKDILSIINQVSSKNPDENTVGRFGTGFMSTFRLSEEVTIRSVLRDTVTDDSGEEKLLPYRTFEVTLDRHGHSKEEVNESIQRSMSQLSGVDENVPEKEFDPEEFNTSFVYKLDTEDSRICAQTGVNDLKNTVRYILLFAPSIESVEIVNNISGEHVTFGRGEKVMTGETLGSLEITEKSADADISHKLVFCTDGELTLAALCENGSTFREFDSLTPRVFTIFPLVGAEQFPFPVVINSIKFRPNEPRNGITLVDNAQSVDAAVNKELMKRAVDLYGEMLENAAANGFTGLENIVSIPEWHDDKEMSAEWVKENIYNALFAKLYSCRMIRTAEGVTSLSDSTARIIDGIDETEKNAVKALVSQFSTVTVPEGSERWNEALRNYPLPDEKIINAEKLFLNASEYLKTGFGGSTAELVKWCSELCALSGANEALRQLILSSEAKVFPSQDEEELKAFRLRSFSEIFADPDIPEILKNVSAFLDRLIAPSYNEPLKIRQSLLHRDFAAADIPMPPKYEPAKLIKYITDRSNRGYPVYRYMYNKQTYDTAWYNAWLLMVSCMKDRAFYDSCKLFLGSDLPGYTTLDDSYYESFGMWRGSVSGLFYIVCGMISNLKNITGLKEKLGCETDDETFSHLAAFIAAAKKNGCSFDDERVIIFPNLKGVFRRFAVSCSDVQKYSDKLENPVLYEIITAFSGLNSFFDICGVTIDRRIPSELTGFPAMTDSIVSEKINSALLKVFSQGPLASAGEAQQEACTKLLAWIRSDPENAKRYFPNYSSDEDQMKLLTPGSAAKMQKKVDMFDSFMRTHNIDNVEALEELLTNSSRSMSIDDDLTDFFDDSEVYADGLYGVPYDERVELCRRIGEAGEQFFFGYLENAASADGFTVTSRTDHEIKLMRNTDEGATDSIVILRGDHAGYRQSGWDFKVTRNEHGTETVRYYEVKTHSATSVVSSTIKLTNSQMQMAMFHSGNFIVVKLNCDRKTFTCTVDDMYDNIGECIASGRFINYDGYNFNVRKTA